MAPPVPPPPVPPVVVPPPAALLVDCPPVPVRLGLLSSGGKQDLIVHILSRGQRYDVANYDNVTIPTNLDVTNETRQRFGSFYASLFDQTLEKHPKAVVTEYSWDACAGRGGARGDLHQR